MPDLKQSLQTHDLGHLRIIADLWGFELEAPDSRSAVEELTAAMLDEEHLEEVIDDLPTGARGALDDLMIYGGRIPWPRFTRQFGEVREMGPGRRDREQPYRNPVSPAETLWYRGLVGRAFFDTPVGPEEYAYIPEDLIPVLPAPQTNKVYPLGHPAVKRDYAHPVLASDLILDEACTLLAALRLGRAPQDFLIHASHPDASSKPLSIYGLSAEFLLALLSAASLVDQQGLIQPEPSRAFLEASRAEALGLLARAWLNSATLNELKLIPGLHLEGEWENSPLQARRSILAFLTSLPEDTWWSLEGFVAGVKENHSDFQRPAGDYDSWYIRDLNTGEYLRGFEHWDQVEGALIRYVITGPMHWLGFTDLASSHEETITAFRYSKWSNALLKGATPEGLPAEERSIIATSNARISVPRLAARDARYQIARFSIWEEKTNDEYNYRVTPTSLAQAQEQGLRVSHLEAILHRHAEAVPPSLIKALHGWEARGTEARLEKALILRVKTPDMITELRSSRAARFLGDPLGPTTVIVKPGAWEKVLNMLAEIGYLGEAKIED